MSKTLSCYLMFPTIQKDPRCRYTKHPSAIKYIILINVIPMVLLELYVITKQIRFITVPTHAVLELALAKVLVALHFVPVGFHLYISLYDKTVVNFMLAPSSIMRRILWHILNPSEVVKGIQRHLKPTIMIKPCLSSYSWRKYKLNAMRIKK